jgi:hypothetical protein
MFERHLGEQPWREVLAQWWPRLLPGLLGSLGHGLIRTAHAVRGLASVAEPTELQLGELAQGLAFWAVRYTAPRSRFSALAQPLVAQQAAAPDVDAAFSALTGAAAGIYADHAPQPPVPLVHMITTPAAVHMTLPELPVELHADSYRYACLAAASIVDIFAPMLGDRPVCDGVPPLADSLAAAAEIGDEHAIKLAEACAREHAGNADERYPRAAGTLILHLTTPGS